MPVARERHWAKTSARRACSRAPTGGEYWRSINSNSPTFVDEFVPTWAFVIDPTDASIVYAAGDVFGVLKTTDGGATWSSSHNGIGGDGAWVTALAIDASRPQFLYAGSEQFGVFKSLDAGTSWRRTALHYEITGLLFYSGRLYAAVYGTNSPIYSSSDMGMTWHECSAGLTLGPRGRVIALAIDPATEAVPLYAGTTDGVFAAFTSPCVSDCNGDGQVSVDEVVALLNIALGAAYPLTCQIGLPIGKEVDITLLVQAVNNAMDGCGTQRAQRPPSIRLDACRR